MSNLKLIQGDSFNVTFTVIENSDLISDLIFSSRVLKLEKTLTKIDDNQWLFSLTPEETMELPSVCGTFDLTAILQENQVETLIYQGNIKVSKKINTIGTLIYE